MEIKKHGNIKQKETFEAKCYNCGCEFIANRSETYTIATPVAAAICNGIIRKFRYCDCPDCKNMVMIEEVDMQGNPIKLEDSCKETAPDRSDCMYYDEGYGCETNPMKRCDICHDYTPEIKVGNIPSYAKVDSNGFIGCQKIESCPQLDEKLIEEAKVTTADIAMAYNDIMRRRYEDNLPWWKKLFRKIFMLAFVALAAVQICSCTHTLEDTDGIVTCVEYQKTKEYTYAVVIKYLDRYGPNNQVNFLTNTLYHVGDTIRLGRPCCKHVTNETDTLK